MATKNKNESHIERTLSDVDRKKHEAYQKLMQELESQSKEKTEC